MPLFIQMNLIYILFAVAVVFAVILFLFLKHKNINKQSNYSMAIFSKTDYNEFKKSGDKVLINTTISFSKKSASKSHLNNLYATTILTGVYLIKDETFTISKVGVI